MSKYILKKDLPFAKAGDEINLTNEMLDHNCVSVKGNDGMMWEIGFYEDVNQLIAEGWIEEVKEIPRDKIKELVEKYPGEVQKEVMKHAARQMKEWHDQQKLKEEPGTLEYNLIYDRYCWNSSAIRLDVSTEKPFRFPIKLGEHEFNILLWCYRDTNSVRVGLEAKKEPKSDKKPREFIIILDSDGKATAISRPGAKAWDYFPSDKKAIWVKETIKVREVME